MNARFIIIRGIPTQDPAQVRLPEYDHVDQRLRPYNLQSAQHPGSQPIEPNKQQPVDAAEGHSFRAFAPQDIELVSKNKDFGFQRGPRPEQSDQGAPDQSAK